MRLHRRVPSRAVVAKFHCLRAETSVPGYLYYLPSQRRAATSYLASDYNSLCFHYTKRESWLVVSHRSSASLAINAGCRKCYDCREDDRARAYSSKDSKGRIERRRKKMPWSASQFYSTFLHAAALSSEDSYRHRRRRPRWLYQTEQMYRRALFLAIIIIVPVRCIWPAIAEQMSVGVGIGSSSPIWPLGVLQRRPSTSDMLVSQRLYRGGGRRPS